MKKLNFLDRFLFFINNIAAIALIVTYCIPYINPESFPSIALLSLAYPTLLGLNLIFVIIWLLKLKPHFLISTIIIAFGYQHIKALFPFHQKNTTQLSEISILSYNVRRFNVYQWIKNPNLKQDIADFIHQEAPDIVCLQEYRNTQEFKLKFPYHFIFNTQSGGQVVYSKYPIVNKGSLNFKGTSNNAIFVDIKVNHQTIRVYNVHMQSFNLDTQKENYGALSKKSLFYRFKNVFKRQASQIKALKNHIQTCEYPSFISGDFNNTAFSWNYKQLTKNHQDAFVQTGSGFGKTYNYFLPFRIDFILVPKQFKVQNFKTYPIKLSDHYPIMTKINMNN